MRQAVLIGLHDENEVIYLRGSEFSLGRGEQKDVHKDLSVSRFHCIFKLENNNWTVLDRSTNGTLLNSKPVSKDISQPIENNDILELNEIIKYRFKYPYKAGKKRRVENNNLPDHSPRVKKSRVITAAEDKTVNCSNKFEVYKLKTKLWREKATIKKLEHDSKEMLNKISELEVQLSNKTSSSVQLEKEILALKGKCTDLQKEKDELQAQSVDNESEINLLRQELQTQIKNTELFSIVETDLQCSICNEIFVKATLLSCGHTFCKLCIEKWRRQKNTCPVCRARIDNLLSCLVIDNYVDQTINVLSPNKKDSRRKLKETHKASLSSTSSDVHNNPTSDRFTATGEIEYISGEMHRNAEVRLGFTINSGTDSTENSANLSNYLNETGSNVHNNSTSDDNSDTSEETEHDSDFLNASNATNTDSTLSNVHENSTSHSDSDGDNEASTSSNETRFAEFAWTFNVRSNNNSDSDDSEFVTISSDSNNEASPGSTATNSQNNPTSDSEVTYSEHDDDSQNLDDNSDSDETEHLSISSDSNDEVNTQNTETSVYNSTSDSDTDEDIEDSSNLSDSSCEASSGITTTSLDSDLDSV